MTATRGEPVSVSGARSGADWKKADCPGKSTDRPPPAPASWPSAPIPGSEETEGGEPPAGLSAVCGGPSSGRAVVELPPSPG